MKCANSRCHMRLQVLANLPGIGEMAAAGDLQKFLIITSMRTDWSAACRLHSFASQLCKPLQNVCCACCVERVSTYQV